MPGTVSPTVFRYQYPEALKRAFESFLEQNASEFSQANLEAELKFLLNACKDHSDSKLPKDYAPYYNDQLLLILNTSLLFTAGQTFGQIRQAMSDSAGIKNPGIFQAKTNPRAKLTPYLPTAQTCTAFDSNGSVMAWSNLLDVAIRVKKTSDDLATFKQMEEGFRGLEQHAPSTSQEKQQAIHTLLAETNSARTEHLIQTVGLKAGKKPMTATQVEIFKNTISASLIKHKTTLNTHSTAAFFRNIANAFNTLITWLAPKNSQLAQLAAAKISNLTTSGFFASKISPEFVPPSGPTQNLTPASRAA